MLQTHERLFSNTIVLADLALVCVAMLVGWLWPYSDSVQTLGTAHTTHSFGLVTLWAVLSWFVLSGRSGLYRSRRTERFRREVASVVETWIVTLGVTALFSQLTWRTVGFYILPALGTGVLLLVGTRLAIRALLRELRVRGRNTRFAIIVGRGRNAQLMSECLASRRHYGMVVRGNMRFASETLSPPGEDEELGPVSELQEYLRDNSVDYVLLCPSLDTQTGEIQRVLLTCERAGIACHYTPCHFSEGQNSPSVAWYGGIPTFSFSHPARPISAQLKRLTDVVGSTIGLALLSPAFLAIAVAIKIQDWLRGEKGPVFFRQTRVGHNGRRFTCLKFRTMCVDAELLRATLDEHNEQDGPVFKIKDDPRITPVGRLLRKFSLDELPQLINVWVGDMSLVGPRPPTPDEVERYDWWRRRRISVRPGLTCVWQVWGRNRVSFERWMEMDLYYIDNWSLWLDFKLILHTFRVVALGTGM